MGTLSCIEGIPERTQCPEEVKFEDGSTSSEIVTSVIRMDRNSLLISRLRGGRGCHDLGCTAATGETQRSAHAQAGQGSPRAVRGGGARSAQAPAGAALPAGLLEEGVVHHAGRAHVTTDAYSGEAGHPSRSKPLTDSGQADHQDDDTGVLYFNSRPFGWTRRRAGWSSGHRCSRWKWITSTSVATSTCPPPTSSTPSGRPHASSTGPKVWPLMRQADGGIHDEAAPSRAGLPLSAGRAAPDRREEVRQGSWRRRAPGRCATAPSATSPSPPSPAPP